MTRFEISYARSRLARMYNVHNAHSYLDDLESINMRFAISQMLIVALSDNSYPHLVPVLKEHLEIPEHLTLK